MHISNLIEQAADFDIIHNHFDFLPLTYSRLIRCPVITTIHGFSSEEIIPVYKKYNSNTFYVSISHSNRHPDLRYLDTVYNGINEELFTFGKGEGDYLLYFGRFHPHKGAHEAIRIAVQSNKRLILCGLIQDELYFEEQVVPYLNDSSIIYKGNVGPALRNELMAFNLGSMPELIRHGSNGFLVNNTNEAVAAVAQVSRIDRQACRKYAMDKFSSTTMARHYIQLYEKIARQQSSL